jgi:ActR/RegA family two-component response regulator
MELDIIGFQAQQAEDRIEGIVKLRDELPEIIMSDLQMSPTAGIEFISVVCRRFASPAQRAHQSEAARRQERAAGGIKYE